MTQVQDQQRVQQPVSAVTLGAAFDNVLLFVAKDAARPTLEHVQVRCSDGVSHLESTDSYRAARVSVSAECSDFGPVLVHRSDLASMSKMLKGAKYGTAAISVDEQTFSVSAQGSSVSGRIATEYAWPNTDQFDWSADVSEETGFVGVNPETLAKLGKLKLGSVSSLRWTLRGSLKPSLISSSDGSVLVLVMPVRVA